MEYEQVFKKLKSLSRKNQKNIDGMLRFGIRPKTKILCIPVPELRKMAKEIRKNHNFAIKLWKEGIHEARILASMIAEPDKLTEKQMDAWTNGFDSWDVCDQVCMNLFFKNKAVYEKIKQYAKSEKEFVRRTAFSLIAVLALKDKTAKDQQFIKFFPLIRKYSTDERNFVKKAVNWAIRQIGKRNANLNKEAIELSQEIKRFQSKSAKWIAGGVIRELTDPKIQERIKKDKN